MAKFRMKLQEFVAHQWNGEGHSVPGIEAVFDRKEGTPNDGTNRYFVVIEDNRRYLEPSDWVIYTAQGVPYKVLKDNHLREIADEVV